MGPPLPPPPPPPPGEAIRSEKEDEEWAPPEAPFILRHAVSTAATIITSALGGQWTDSSNRLTVLPRVVP
jgi:hypothetical protein